MWIETTGEGSRPSKGALPVVVCDGLPDSVVRNLTVSNVTLVGGAGKKQECHLCQGRVSDTTPPLCVQPSVQRTRGALLMKGDDAIAWSGPTVRLLPSGRLRIRIAAASDGSKPPTCIDIPSTWVAINAPLQRVWHNSSEGWAIFDLQLSLARSAGVRVLSMVLNEWEFAEPSTEPATLSSRAYALEGVRRALAVWPEALLVLRLGVVVDHY